MKAVIVLVDIQTGEAVTRLFEGEGAVEAAAKAIEPLRQEYPGRSFALFANQAAKQAYGRQVQQEVERIRQALSVPISPSLH